MMEDTVQQAAASAGGSTLSRVAYLALACGLHLAAVGAWLMWPQRPMPAAPVVAQKIDLADHSAAIRAFREGKLAAQTQPKKALASARPPKPDEKTAVQGVVVDLPPSADGLPPEHADYLAERNAHIEHETRSRHASADYPNVMHERTTQYAAARQQTPQAPAAKTMAMGQPKPIVKDSAHKPSELSGEPAQLPQQTAQDRLALPVNHELAGLTNQNDAPGMMGNSARLHLASATPATPEADAAQGAAEQGRGLTMADLLPSIGTLARLNGGASNDALEGVELGDGTFLNAREYKYAAFFGRIKRGVSQFWRPTGEMQRRDPTGAIYGQSTRTTAVQVTLGADGEVEQIVLAHSSGVDFLDREALRAFKEAAPFPNPPRGLMDATGQLKFQFSFVLDFTGHGFFEAPY